jgi:hypothetical protein
MAGAAIQGRVTRRKSIQETRNGLGRTGLNNKILITLTSTFHEFKCTSKPVHV